MPTIDQYSLASFPIEMRFNNTHLSQGTGFAWEYDGQIYLITNWHNITGKNPATGEHLSKTLAEPNSLHAGWNVRDHLGTKTAVAHPLRDDDETPLWLVHPQLGRSVDVVALPVDLPSTIEPYPINGMAWDPLMVAVGHDVFVLGYPYGIGVSGLPIWKRGSVASEPQALDPGSPVILIDTASRPGMSGSPVVRRSWVHAQMDNGGVVMGPAVSTRWVGIYSGRLHSTDPLDAELGMMWPATLVPEIVNGGVRGN